MAGIKTEQRLEREGWKFVSYEYLDGCQHLVANRLMDEGYEVKFVRERTDTKGLWMVSVWKRKEV